MGTAFRAGSRDSFDRYLWGGFGGSPVRRGDDTLLLYQGARGYSESQRSVTHRSIGVAISGDGVSFTKYPGNPVIAWSAHGGGEEGAASVAAAIGPRGKVEAFYGANTMMSPTLVNADVRWANSDEGKTFTDRGVALPHDDAAVFGWGDELFPVNAFLHDGRWHVYYLPNGGGRPRGELGVAVRSRPDDLSYTAAVHSGRKRIRAWGMQSAANLCDGTYAVSLNGETERTITVPLINVAAP